MHVLTFNLLFITKSNDENNQIQFSKKISSKAAVDDGAGGRAGSKASLNVADSNGSHQNLFKNPTKYICPGQYEDTFESLILIVQMVNWDTKIHNQVRFGFIETCVARNVGLILLGEK